jgi:hypothetical protein
VQQDQRLAGPAGNVVHRHAVNIGHLVTELTVEFGVVAGGRVEGQGTGIDSRPARRLSRRLSIP